jgi:hypothetical protein
MPQEQYSGIVARLKALQTKMAGLDAARGLVRCASLVILAFVLLMLLTKIVWPSSAVRIIIDLVTILGLGAAFYFFVVKPYTHRKSFLTLARLLETKYGKFQSRLIAALELHEIAVKNREGYSLELIEKTIDEAGGVIADTDTNAAINYKPLRHAISRLGVLAVIVFCSIFLNSTTAYNAWTLFTHPATNSEKPPEFSLTVKPDGGEIFRNTDLLVQAKADGRIPHRVDIYYKFEDGSWASEPMGRGDSISLATFAYTFKKVKRSVDIYAKSGGVSSRKAHLEVVDPPRLADITLTFDYPQYAGLPQAHGNPNDGNVAALRGTKITIAASSNKPLSECYQLFADSTRAPLEVDGDKITGAFSVKDNGRYALIMKDKAGRINPEPIWYDIQAMDDYPPAITIRFPGADVDLDEHITLPLELGITDDYGFDKLNLVYWTQSEGSQTEPVKEAIKIIDKRTLDQVVDYTWNMQSLNPLPGDLIYYYCEVSDNDIISGPKWAKSRTFSARLPNLDEILADVQGSQEQQMESLDEALKNQKDLQKQVEDIAREMQKKSDVNWEKKQEVQKILEKQQEVAKKIDDLSKEMQSNLDKLENNKLIGEQIAEKMQQLQQLMEEVAPPELKDAMQKLQDALQKMDPEALKKALQQFQLTSEQLLENLERTISLMQKLAIEQKMDMLVQMAEKIKQAQEEINKAVDAARDSSELAKQQPPENSNASDCKTLQDQFKELLKMDEKEQMVPEKEKAEATEKVNNPEIQQDFLQMKPSLCSGGKSSCQKTGKKLQSELSEMADALKKAQQAMQNEQKMEIARKMQKAAEDLLYLSGRQENLLDSTKTNMSTGDGLRRLASNQMQIATASSRIADNISELSKESVFINMALMNLLGISLSNMSSATDQLDKRFAPGAIQNEQFAMSNLNKTVYLLLDARQNAMNSGSGSGMQEMIQQMQKMSEMQAGINGQTMMQMPQPGMSMSYGQQQAMGQLAAQQEALRQKLQEMNEQFGKQGDMLGRLDQLGEEMKKVVDDMQRSQVNRETIKRQEGILTRLLDAQKSVNRREYSKKRQSESGEDIVRKSPLLPDDLANGKGELSEMIKKALEEQYPRQYDKLIKAYFKSFQSQGTTNEK